MFLPSRWETLVKACRQLQQLEDELRALKGVKRSILADKVGGKDETMRFDLFK